MLITPTEHEKSEWARMATAAYAADKNDVGHSFSVAASLPKNCTMMSGRFDKLQTAYRRWLVDNKL